VAAAAGGGTGLSLPEDLHVSGNRAGVQGHCLACWGRAGVQGQGLPPSCIVWHVGGRAGG
jgi:hypothetical protein